MGLLGSAAGALTGASAVSAGMVASGATATTGAVATATAIGLASLVTGGTILVVGCNSTDMDCWKQIVHDTSSEKSNGILLETLQAHKNVLSSHVNNDILYIQNIWDEKFKISVSGKLDNSTILLHASIV